MKLKIKEISYSKLYKLEIPRLAKRVIEIIETHNPELLKIKEVYDLLVAVKPQMDALKVPYGASPITEQLIPLRRNLLMYVAAINNHMSIVVREDLLVQAESVKIAKIFIKSYFADLVGSKNEELISEKVYKFFMQIDQDEELETILTTLGFANNLDKLRSVFATHQELLNRRLTSNSQRPLEKTPDLKEPILEALKDMFMQIRVAQLKNDKLDYSPLISELNQQLDHYRNLINIREAYNKRQAEKKKESEQSVEIPDTTEATEPASRMMNLNVVGVNGSDESGTQSIEQEKAVAASTKHKQPPSLNNEDSNCDHNLI